jgi:hypothetical protein
MSRLAEMLSAQHYPPTLFSDQYVLANLERPNVGL